MTRLLPTVLFVCTDWYEVGGAGASLIDHIESLKGDIEPLVLVNAEGEMSRRLQEMSVEVIAAQFFYLWERPKPFAEVLRNPLRATAIQSRLRDHLCLRKVKEQLVGRKIDIVHSNSTVATIGSLLARALGAKHVWHVREYLDLAFGIDIYGGRKRLTHKLRQADYRICVSKAIRQHWGLTDSHTAVVHDVVKHPSPPSTDITREPWVLFCAAQITAEKGAETAVEAFGRSSLWREGFQLVFVGRCAEAYKAKLIDIATQHDCAETLRFEGYHADVLPYFMRARVFVMASHYEGLGRVTIEAMLCGCPVVARRSGGTLDIVEHGRTGLLFDTDDQCATLLRQAAMRPDPTIATQAHDFATTHFAPQHYREQLTNIYHTLLQGV